MGDIELERPFSHLRRSHRSHPAVQEAAELHGHNGSALLPILQHVQTDQSHVDSSCLGAAADVTGISDAQAYGVASFYSLLSTSSVAKTVIRVCDGPVCRIHGGEALRAASEAAATDKNIQIQRTSCLGQCDRSPACLVNLEPAGPVSPDKIQKVLKGWRGERRDYSVAHPSEFRVAMQRVGSIDPEDIQSCIIHGGYQQAAIWLRKPPQDLIDVISQSGLRGCGGAGFPTGTKWQLVADANSEQKYVVCNADESEPGVFKDRVLLEEDPHLLLESMLLTGYATGAGSGVIYIRGEYEFAALRLERAIQQATALGWLGENINESGFRFGIQVHRGAGAYICGEETALLNSLEGHRGEPRLRPPYPTSHGLNGKPTVINNVETLCKVPLILQHGAGWYRGIGSENGHGTRLFTVTGHVNRPGCYELPVGITLRHLIEEVCGGISGDSKFKMALTGGAAGSLVDVHSLDVPLDFRSHEKGVMLGSGAVLVMNQHVQVIDLLQSLLIFFAAESCGKCTPCRIGTMQARERIEALRTGEGSKEDLDQLKSLSQILRSASLCGLGKSVSWPLDSALLNFGEELFNLVAETS